MLKKLCLTLAALFFTFPVFGKLQWRGYFQTDYTSSENPSRDEGFQLRRINLIFNRPISKSARAFADIEYEDGTEISGDGGQGEVKISRGFVEFRLSRDLKLAAGKFLTPYGYYNEIHDFSASYIPIDPPALIYGKNPIFSGNPSKRLYAKYSTGLRFNYVKNSLTIKSGVANGSEQTNTGTDSNKSPMFFFKSEYKFLDDSTLSLSYIKEKTSSNELPKWEEHGNISINIEFLKWFLISEAGIGYTRLSTSNIGQSYFNQSHLLGVYLGEAYAAYINYQVLNPDRSNSDNLFQTYSLGFNYHYNIFTIFKAEIQKQNIKTLNSKYDYLTQQLSISMLF